MMRRRWELRPTTGDGWTETQHPELAETDLPAPASPALRIPGYCLGGNEYGRLDLSGRSLDIHPKEPT